MAIHRTRIFKIQCFKQSRSGFTFGLVFQVLGQIGRKTSLVMRDRHIIIVEYHQQISICMRGVVQCFKGHACGHRTVTDDGNGFTIDALQFIGDSHA